MFDNIKSIPKSKEILEAEKVLVEVFRITKIYNQKAMINITDEDLRYLAKNLSDEYLQGNFEHAVSFLRAAVEEFFKRASTVKHVEIGDFLKVCYAKKRREVDDAASQALLAPKRLTPKSIAKENIEQIKKQLTNAIKPLPYNKNYREPPECKYRISKSGKKETEMNIHELREHLSEKRMELHNDLVSYGTLKHHSDVENPELRALYLKAWSHEGVTRDEKDRMKVLARLSGETIAGV
jgi:hypothetical protein